VLISDKQTAKYASLFPEATIYSFEPFPASFRSLQKRFEGSTLIRPVQLAVSNRVGRSVLYVSKASVMNSLLPPIDSTGQGFGPNSEPLEIHTTTIDSFSNQESLAEMQVLKMDIQGGELMALRGAIGRLQAGSISLIYTELLFAPLYQGQAEFYEICHFLSRYGYTLFNLYDLAYGKDGHAKWGDAIFIGPRLTSQLWTNAHRSTLD
jgi:FkbM family methyltransferase